MNPGEVITIIFNNDPIFKPKYLFISYHDGVVDLMDDRNYMYVIKDVHKSNKFNNIFIGIQKVSFPTENVGPCSNDLITRFKKENCKRLKHEDIITHNTYEYNHIMILDKLDLFVQECLSLYYVTKDKELLNKLTTNDILNKVKEVFHYGVVHTDDRSFIYTVVLGILNFNHDELQILKTNLFKKVESIYELEPKESGTELKVYTDVINNFEKANKRQKIERVTPLQEKNFFYKEDDELIQLLKLFEDNYFPLDPEDRNMMDTLKLKE
jgi:hypothetical protein